MTSIVISGASDDLVEVVGEVPGCNEYSAYDNPLFVELSTGDVFRVEYTELGVWEVRQCVYGGLKAIGGTVQTTPHASGDDPDPYTDIVAVMGNIEWVEVWESYPPTVGEKRHKIGHELADDEDGFDRDRLLSDDDVAAVWAILATAKRRAK